MHRGTPLSQGGEGAPGEGFSGILRLGKTDDRRFSGHHSHTLNTEPMAARLLREQVIGLSFSYYDEDEIRRSSVKRITNPNTFTNGNTLFDTFIKFCLSFTATTKL